METGKKVFYYLRKLRPYRFVTTVYGDASEIIVKKLHPFNVAKEPNSGFKAIDKKSFRNKMAYYIVIGGKLAHVSWVFKNNLLARQLKFRDHLVIGDCITYDGFKGMGLYGEVVAQIITQNKKKKYLLFIEPDNLASIRGVEKIGLKCLGVFEVFRFLGLAIRIKKV